MGSISHFQENSSTSGHTTITRRVPFKKKRGSRWLILLALFFTITMKIVYSNDHLFESDEIFLSAINDASGMAALSRGKLMLEGLAPVSVSDFPRKVPVATGIHTPVYSEATKRTMQYYESEDADVVKMEMKARREARARRVRPPPPPQEAIVQYGFDFLDIATTSNENEESSSSSKNISIHHLTSTTATHDLPKRCGLEFQSLFSENSSDFPPTNSIHKDSVVLITGILSQLGFHLALKLATACDVKIMIGVDSYATDQIYRERMLEQITLFYSQVPSLRTPLILSPMGAVPNAIQHRYYEDFVNTFTGELEFSSTVIPTHIVHIGSRDELSFHADSSSNGNSDSKPNSNSDSAHSSGSSNGSLYWLRHSLIMTEQILSHLDRISSPVHVTFVSDVDVMTLNGDSLHPINPSFEKNKYFSSTTKLMEELIVQSYATRLDNHHFVTLRLPQLFGPWGKPGAFDYDIAQTAIMHWHDEDTMSRDSDSKPSMLLNSTGLSHASQSEMDLLFIDDAVHSVMASMQYSNCNEGESNTSSFSLSGDRVSFATFAEIIESHMPMFIDKEAVASKDATRLQIGVTQLLAWHLNRFALLGSHQESSIEANPSGMEFLLKEGEDVCAPDDIYCLRGHPVYPCASECSDAALCTSSPFDMVIETSHLVTKGCATVMYTTMFLNKDETRGLPKAPAEFEAKTICSIAFVDGSKQINPHNIKKFRDGDKTVKIKRHNGWYIIPVEIDSTGTLPIELSSLLKISPGNFFHSDVERALHLAENFIRNPSERDIIFTAGLVQSLAPSPKSFRKAFNYEIGHTKREALIAFPAMQIVKMKSQDILSGSVSPHSEKISAGIGLKQILKVDPDNKGLVKNLNLYHKDNSMPHLIYNNCELNSDCDYKFSLDHWTRDDWLVHNLSPKASKQLRCEWYREHTRWEFSNEILSFAQVTARLGAERFNRIDDMNEKDRMMEEQKQKRIDGTTDDHEWHAIYDQEYVRILDTRSMVLQRNFWENFVLPSQTAWRKKKKKKKKKKQRL
uniref:Uncharacterized protein n=1 Tax=Chaetoceros debilis TaxID=122233 RepID=A0A7S3QAK6_9STRA